MDYYKVPAISNSSLKYIDPDMGGNRTRFKRFIIDREDDSSDDKSKYYKGSLVHDYIEDKSQFIVLKEKEPSKTVLIWVMGVMNKLEDLGVDVDDSTLWNIALEVRTELKLYGNYKDWDKLKVIWTDALPYVYERLRARGKKHITSEEHDMILNCINAIVCNERGYELLLDESNPLLDYYREEEFYWEEKIEIEINPIEDKVTIPLKFKSKLDRVYVNHDTKEIFLVDLKTTSKPITLFKDSINRYKYGRQIAFYKNCILHNLSQLNADEDYSVHCFIVAVETTVPHECRVFAFNEDTITENDRVRRNLIEKIAYGEYENWREDICRIEWI